MVRVWYHDGSDSDPTQPHMLHPDQYLTLQDLNQEIGLEFFQKYAKFRRLFSEQECWVAFNRPEGDSHPIRRKYLQNLGVLVN
ncbi:hypothetical protein PoB_004269000 [Plakobranchus ocellatus]|uniref:Uncharacterized protein n=1 Tax=Plakobranchus ocellatus TaxID=259542 RepID=A0AAV4BAR6_9GAST|nr:hypothetical protein PoB_004269000 [Plakobranchus ocellatus]